MNRITESANDSPVSKDFAMSLNTAADEDIYNTYAIKERMHFAWSIVMIISYFLGASAQNQMLLNFSVLLFVLFVILSVIYNQVRELNRLFSINKGKSEFPVNRILSTNAVVTAVIAILMGVFMLFFYYGKYGNIFTIIGSIFIVVFRLILKGILVIWGLGPKNTTSNTSTEESTSEDFVSFSGSSGVDNSAVLNSIFEAVALVLILGLIVLILYFIFKYAKGFGRGKIDEMDEVEFINDKKEVNNKTYSTLRKKAEEKVSNNEAYRRIYKRYVKSYKKMTKFKKSGLRPNNLMPEDISRKLIIEDEIKANIITESYEKARYSNKVVTKEEIKYLKNL